jgi:hypothetical protein
MARYARRMGAPYAPILLCHTEPVFNSQSFYLACPWLVAVVEYASQTMMPRGLAEAVPAKAATTNTANRIATSFFCFVIRLPP